MELMNAFCRDVWTNYRSKLMFALTMAVAFSWIAYMALDNERPFVYDVSQSLIIPSTAKDGDAITVKWRLKMVNRICPGSNTRILFDPRSKAIITSFDPTPAASQVDIKDMWLIRSFVLPRALLPPGEEIGYRAKVCYQCNAFQQFYRPLCFTTPDLFFRTERQP